MRATGLGRPKLRSLGVPGRLDRAARYLVNNAGPASLSPITFAEGLVFFHGQWLIYYGCADSLVAVATAPKK